jgi:hypothetical protein
LFRSSSYSKTSIISFSVEELLQVNDPGTRSILFLLLMPNAIDVFGNVILGVPHVLNNEVDHLLKNKS